MAVVSFNPTAFKTRYPEFTTVADGTLGACFDEATLYLSNTDASPVQDIARRTIYLSMLTAHIAFIGGTLNPGGIPNPVGRVSTAGEGSVSANLEYSTPGSQAWFVQTQYGAAFWQATSSLRGFRYIVQPTRF
jgi:hypothetical protein